MFFFRFIGHAVLGREDAFRGSGGNDDKNSGDENGSGDENDSAPRATNLPPRHPSHPRIPQTQKTHESKRDCFKLISEYME